MKGAVASGHKLTSEAAIEILNKGGNAFDAVVAAAFTTVVAEPCLSSLGGGGFLLGWQASGHDPFLYDFFVNSPGIGAPAPRAECIEDPASEGCPHFIPIDVHFSNTTQVFHAGHGAVAVPGMLKGLVEFYKEHCTLEIEDLVAPAIRALDEGVEINGLQQYLLRILKPILTLSDYGKELYEAPRGNRIHNPMLKEFLALGDPDLWIDKVYGKGAIELEQQMHTGQGLLSARDLHHYKVIKTDPLRFKYRGHEILTNPSLGGELLAMAFTKLQCTDFPSMNESRRLATLAQTMRQMNEYHGGTGGTTHISIVDSEGNAASLTSSNGSNSGFFIDGTGIMLNNMMGEDDLHPDGFYTMAAGQRVGSMMSPSLIIKDGAVETVLGSGGSKRIRTAMLQSIHNLLDQGMSIKDAIETPRIHLDDTKTLQVEPGVPGDSLTKIPYTINQWDHKDLYFGGVHAVMANYEGWGDTRRDGSFMGTTLD
jgi:gamma-glutamyltranspeptidase/glutathione hydrolase